MADKLDCVVVGAGVVGLAIAKVLAEDGRDVVVLEAESQIGMHTSSRNSEVIHAGLYYPENSLKARFCVQGKKMLYAYCEEHRIGCNQLGKLIVARDAGQFDRLTEINTQAVKNGVPELIFLSADDVREIEPHVECAGALLSPSTGIIDSHGLMMSLQADIESQGGAVVLNSEVTDLKTENAGLSFEIGGEAFICRTLVNSAGLWAQQLVSGDGLPSRGVPTVRYAKGHYFAYRGKSPFSRLIYPLPTESGLGIHATNDMGGAARFGPDVEWVDEIDYDSDESRKAHFVAIIKSYFPELDDEKLTPAYTGIRPKLSGPGEAAADFVIQSDADHGIRGLVNLFGIESPGLTACLAIGQYVRELAR